MSTTLFFVRVNNPLNFGRSEIENTCSDALFDKFGELWQISQANDSAYEDENIHVYDLSDSMENDRYMQDFNDQILDNYWCYVSTDDDAVKRFNDACDRHAHKMKRYRVTIPYNTFLSYEVDAESEYDAVKKAEKRERHYSDRDRAQIISNISPEAMDFKVEEIGDAPEPTQKAKDVALKKYSVRVPFHTFIDYEVEAASEQEAEEIAEDADYDMGQILDNMTISGVPDTSEITD